MKVRDQDNGFATVVGGGYFQEFHSNNTIQDPASATEKKQTTRLSVARPQLATGGVGILACRPDMDNLIAGLVTTVSGIIARARVGGILELIAAGGIHARRHDTNHIFHRLFCG